MDGALITSPAMLIARHEDTIKSIVSCRAIDEAKFYVDRAAALEAFARIQKDKRLERESKAERLWAFRQLGKLSAKERPGGLRPHENGHLSGGSKPGPVSLLMQHGMTKNDAQAARALALIDEKKFSDVVSLPRPPSPASWRNTHISQDCSPSWLNICAANGLRHCLYWTRKYSAKDLAKGLKPDEAKKAKQIVAEISAWLNDFEACS